MGAAAVITYSSLGNSNNHAGVAQANQPDYNDDSSDEDARSRSDEDRHRLKLEGDYNHFLKEVSQVLRLEYLLSDDETKLIDKYFTSESDEDSILSEKLDETLIIGGVSTTARGTSYFLYKSLLEVSYYYFEYDHLESGLFSTYSCRKKILVNMLKNLEQIFQVKEIYGLCVLDGLTFPEISSDEHLRNISLMLRNSRELSRATSLLSLLGLKLNPQVSEIVKRTQEFNYLKDIVFDTLKFDCLTILDKFVELGGTVNEQDVMGNSLLHRASKDGAEQIVTQLLNYQANTRSMNRSGQFPIELSFEHKHDVITKALIVHGSPLNPGSSESKPFAHRAVENSNYELLNFLQDNGANLTSLDEEGRPLYGCYMDAKKELTSDDYRILGLLARLNIQLEWIDDKGDNILTSGIKAERGFKWIELIINKFPATLDHTNPQSGNNPLHEAVTKNNIILSRFLIGKGCPMDDNAVSGASLYALAQASDNPQLSYLFNDLSDGKDEPVQHTGRYSSALSRRRKSY